MDRRSGLAHPDEWHGHPLNNGFDGICSEYYAAALKAEIDTNYWWSLAPTGRAACRGKCRQNIPKDSVRFVTEVEIYHQQPGQATWYQCLSCVTPKMVANLEARFGSLEAMHGFGSLKPPGQQAVRALKAAATAAAGAGANEPKQKPKHEPKHEPKQEPTASQAAGATTKKRRLPSSFGTGSKVTDAENPKPVVSTPEPGLASGGRDAPSPQATAAAAVPAPAPPSSPAAEAKSEAAESSASVAPTPEGTAAAKPAAKKPRVGKPTVDDWKKMVGASEFQRVSVAVGSETFGLRANQQAELRAWASGSWDKDWLVLRSGVPHAFISNAGEPMRLSLSLGPD